MCLGGGGSKPSPPPYIPPPPPPVAPAPAPLPPPTPVAPPPPRQISGVGQSGAEGGFKAGRKRKKDRSAVSRGTGQLRIPRTGVSTGGGGDKGPSGVGGID